MAHTDVTNVPDFTADRPDSTKNPNSRSRDSNIQRKMFSYAAMFGTFLFIYLWRLQYLYCFSKLLYSNGRTIEIGWKGMKGVCTHMCQYILYMHTCVYANMNDLSTLPFIRFHPNLFYSTATLVSVIYSMR